MQAGIPRHRLVIALEPEVASLYCQYSCNMLRPRTQYLVVDLGGRVVLWSNWTDKLFYFFSCFVFLFLFVYLLVFWFVLLWFFSIIIYIIPPYIWMLSSDWVMKGVFFLSLLFFALSPSPGYFPLGIPYSVVFVGNSLH